MFHGNDVSTENNDNFEVKFDSNGILFKGIKFATYHNQARPFDPSNRFCNRLKKRKRKIQCLLIVILKMAEKI